MKKIKDKRTIKINAYGQAQMGAHYPVEWVEKVWAHFDKVNSTTTGMYKITLKELMYDSMNKQMNK